MGFRCSSLTLNLCGLKQIRRLTLGNALCMKHDLLKSCSEIPDFPKLYEEYKSIKSAEVTFKKNLYHEFWEECDGSKNKVTSEYQIRKLMITQPIQVLQEKNVILSMDSITNELLSNLEPFPFNKDELLHVNKEQKLNMKFIRNTIESQYLAWKYKVDVEEIKNILKRLQLGLYSYRSLRTLKKNVSLLETIPETKNIKVSEKIYHLNQIPFDLNSVINFQDKIAGLIWHVFPQHCPGLLKFSHQYILFVVSVLQVLEFTEEQIRFGLPFLHYNFLVLIEKLNDLLKNPALKKYRNEPMFLCLLSLKNNTLLDVASLHNSSFEEIIDFIKTTSNALKIRYTTLRSVLYHLSNFYKIDKSRFTEKCNWDRFRIVPEVQIYDTLVFLKEMGCTSQELEDTTEIIFYHRDLIAKAMEKVQNESESLMKLGFDSDFASDSNFFSNGIKDKKKILQLCLYFMAK